MANNYSQCTPVQALKATKKEADELIRLGTLTEEEQEEQDCYHGFQLEYYEDDREFYMYAEEYGNEGDLPDEFLTALGRLIAKNKLEYLEFGYAFTCDKMRPGEFGGGKFRVYADGKIEYPDLVWGRETKNGK